MLLSSNAGAVGIGAVGLRPAEVEGLWQGGNFRLVATCDEGLPDAGQGSAGAGYYSDYNMLLRDPAVEAVLVGGPVGLRRDFAVRALNAGRHAILLPPFCETALDAERVLKTALRQRLIATMELPWRDEADLRALLAAIEGEGFSSVQGALCFVAAPDAALSPRTLLAQKGLALVDSLRRVARADVASVRVHLRHGGDGPGEAFAVYMALRDGGWAAASVSAQLPAGLPGWVVYAGRCVVSAAGGQAVVLEGGQRRVYEAPSPVEGFWDNLYSAIRHGAELKCHPAQIVRAMKLHEAALESAESGEAVAV